MEQANKLDRKLLEELLENPLYFDAINDIVIQQVKGKEKYDTLLTVDKWDLIEYLEHFLQELTDGRIYLGGVLIHLKEQLEGWDLGKDYLHLKENYREALAVIDRQAKEIAQLKR